MRLGDQPRYEIMVNERFKIEGMSCTHCVRAVQEELNALPVNVKSVDVGAAEVEYDPKEIRREQIEEAIQDAGYKVSNIAPGL
jgi:copper chaperone